MTEFPTDRFWFFEWLDDHRVNSIEDFQRIATRRRVLDDLHHRALAALEGQETIGAGIQIDPRYDIVAGADMDLSGEESCAYVGCRLRQVEELFRRAWFYFDRIVIADSVSPHLASPDTDELWLRDLFDHVTVLLRVREIGAEDLVAFHRKDLSFCQDCTPRALREAGISEQRVDEYITNYARGARAVTESVSGDGRIVLLTHPKYRGLCEVGVPNTGKGSLKAKASNIALRGTLQSLLVDSSIARALATPLGTTDAIYHDFMTMASPDVAQVAFNLNLPVLDNVPIDTLIKIRTDETHHFERFRDSLRRAVREQLAVKPERRTDEIALEITSDIIEPELRQIGRRLKAADDTLARKTGVAVGVGALITTCGLVTGLIPAIILGSSVIAGGIVVPRQQYYDRIEDIQLSDMFFLWKALEHRIHPED